MRRRLSRSCTYAVALDSNAGRGEVQALAHYLSTPNHTDCEVLVVDGSPAEAFDEHHRVLRWARDVCVSPGSVPSDTDVPDRSGRSDTRRLILQGAGFMKRAVCL